MADTETATAQSELDKAQAALDDARAKYVAASNKAKPPRTAEEIVTEWIELVNMRLENPPPLRALLAELRASSDAAKGNLPPAAPETKPE